MVRVPWQRTGMLEALNNFEVSLLLKRYGLVYRQPRSDARCTASVFNRALQVSESELTVPGGGDRVRQLGE